MSFDQGLLEAVKSDPPGEAPMHARNHTPDDPILARIAALPVNAVHRASAEADYLAASRSVGRMFALLARIRAIFARRHRSLRTEQRTQY